VLRVACCVKHGAEAKGGTRGAKTKNLLTTKYTKYTKYTKRGKGEEGIVGKWDSGKVGGRAEHSTLNIQHSTFNIQ
jgi:hypothetical protein